MRKNYKIKKTPKQKYIYYKKYAKKINILKLILNKKRG
jgi:hypothetical protein